MEKERLTLDDAIELLSVENCTFAAVWPESNRMYTSEKNGIAPVMLMMKDDKRCFEGAMVADRFLGKAAAMLLIASGAKELYGETVSTHAIKAVEAAQAKTGSPKLSCKEEVPFITGRDGSGMCPMENAVLELSDPDKAFGILGETIKKMMSA